MEEFQKQDAEASTEGSSVDPLDNNEVNTAAKTFMDSLPVVKALARNMKAGGLARVFNAVAEFPLAESMPKFKSDAERQLYIMTIALNKAKNIMVSAVLKEQLNKKEAEMLAPKEGDANGGSLDENRDT